MERNTALTLALAALLILSAGAIASSHTIPLSQNDDGVVLDQPDGPTITLTGNTEIANTSGSVDSNTVRWESTDGSTEFSAMGEAGATIAATDLEGNWSKATSIDTSTADLTIDPDDKSAVTVGGGIDSIEWAGDATVDDGSRAFSYSASSSAKVEIPTDSSNTKIIAVAQSDGAVVGQTTTDSSGIATFDSLDLGSYDVTLSTTSDPTVDNGNASPSGGETLNETPVELSIDVSDPDFGTEHGDEVTATAYVLESDSPDPSTDPEIGSDTLTSNGTAIVWFDDGEGGENQYYWVVKDSYGASEQSDVFLFQLPDELYIRDELTGELLNDTQSNITLTFYGDTSVTRRSTSDGVISLTGLPVGEEIIVVAETDGYYNRRIIIDSLTDQQNVYLLNESVDSVAVTFTLEDLSGQFPSSESKLYLTKAVPNENGSDAETRVIAGDYFGASGRFPVVLEQDSRYSVRIENRDGRVYEAGGFTASVAGEEPIRIGSVKFTPGDFESYTVDHRTKDTEDGAHLDFVFRDPELLTEDFQIAVYPRGDEENATFEDSWFSPREVYEISVELEPDTVYVLEWSATRNGDEIGQRVPVGGDSLIPVPLDSRWLNSMSIVAVVFVASLGGPRYGTVVALGVVGMAGLLALVGFLNISWIGWWVAVSIGVGMHLQGRVR